MMFDPKRSNIAMKEIEPANKILGKTEGLEIRRKLRKGERL